MSTDIALAQELCEVAKQAGFRDGETNDALPQVAMLSFGQRDRRLALPPSYWQLSAYFAYGEDPDLRSVEAFDFVMSQFNHLAREYGAAKARLERSVVVERAATQNIPRHDVQVAITLMVLSEQLIEEAGILRFNRPESGERALPSTGLQGTLKKSSHSGALTILWLAPREEATQQY